MTIDLEKLKGASPKRLLKVIAALLKTIQGLKKANQDLKEQLQEAKRKSKPTATPFSKNRPKTDPKRPGRKPGQGRFTNREAPQAKESDEVHPHRAKLTSRLCPACQLPCEPQPDQEATVIDLPQEIARRIDHFTIEVARCPQCGCLHRGAHPDLPADQYAATAHRVGPRAHAMAATLSFDLGLPVRKAAAALSDLFGLPLSQSAITQKALKATEPQSGPVARQAQEIARTVAASPRVHTDDTGWKQGGRTAFLMGFCTPEAAYFQIRRRHRAVEVAEVIGQEYPGVLITDGGSSYKSWLFEGMDQQKCLSHIQRQLSEVIARQPGKAGWFARHLKGLLTQALELWQASHQGDLSLGESVAQGAILLEQVTHHLRARPLSDPVNASLRAQLQGHHSRGHLLRFLSDRAIEPTNNRAERILRPAVIARKVSHCSKNQRGADAYAAFKSVATTCGLRGQSVWEAFTILFTPRPQELDEPPP